MAPPKRGSGAGTAPASPSRPRTRLLPTNSSPTRGQRGQPAARLSPSDSDIQGVEVTIERINPTTSSYHTAATQYDVSSSAKSSKSTKSTKSSRSTRRRHAPPPPAIRGSAVPDDQKTVWSVLRSNRGGRRSSIPEALARRLRDFNYAYSKRLDSKGEVRALDFLFQGRRAREGRVLGRLTSKGVELKGALMRQYIYLMCRFLSLRALVAVTRRLRHLWPIRSPDLDKARGGVGRGRCAQEAKRAALPHVQGLQGRDDG